MARPKRRSLAVAGVLLAALVAIAIVVQYFSTYSVIRYAENLAIAESAHLESRWTFESTPRGTLIRAQYGVFRGWYLAVDESILPTTAERSVSGAMAYAPMRYVLNPILVERVDDNCYWNFVETATRALVGEDRTTYYLQCATGKYETWNLSFLPINRSDLSSLPPGTFGVAWSLLLVPAGGTNWRLETNDKGTRIYATNASFRPWRLDYRQEAPILERSAWEEVEPRSRGELPQQFKVR